MECVSIRAGADKSRARGIRLHAAAASIVLALACEPQLPPLQAESEHFRFYANDSEFFCPGVVESYERHYTALAPWLGVALDPEIKISVYRHENEDALVAQCDRAVDGCAIGRVVHVDNYQPHELVHAYASQLGRPPHLFSEGIAVVLGCGLEAHTPIDASADIRTMVESRTFVENLATYSRAGGFVRSVLDRHGRETFLRFYARVPFDASFAEIDAAFTEDFGESLDAAIDAWVGGPPQTRAGICLRVAECAAPVLASEALACAPILPGSLPHDDAARYARLSASPDGAVIGWQSSGNILLNVGACPSSAGTASEHSFYEGPGRGELFREGPAIDAWIYAAASYEGDALRASSIAADERGPLVGERCADAPVHDLDLALDRVIVHGPLEGHADDDPIDGLADVTFRFRIGEPRVLRLPPPSWFEEYDSERISICVDGCPSAAGCDEGMIMHGTSTLDDRLLEPGRTYALTVSGMPAGRGYHVELELRRP
jgi:hypothetical protein